MTNNKTHQFSLYPDIMIDLDLAYDSIRFSGNTFPIKEIIKEACHSINQRCSWDSVFKTWTAPLSIIYTDYLKDIVNIDKLPKVENSKRVLGDMVCLSRYSKDKTNIQKVILYGEIDEIRDVVHFYGGHSLSKSQFYRNELLSDLNIEYYEFGSNMSPFANKNLEMFRDVFGLNNIIETDIYGKGVSNKYKNLLDKQKLEKEKQELKYRKYREKIHKSYQKVEIKTINRRKDKRGFVLSVQQIITGPEKDVKIVYNDILSQYCYIGYGTHITNEKYLSKRPKILELTLDRSTTTGD